MMTANGSDPILLFRQAVSFEYAGAVLSAEVHRSLIPWVKSLIEKQGMRAEEVLEEYPIVRFTADTPVIFSFPTFIPMLVNQAFATELYLKSLLDLDGKPNETGHALKGLFGRLSTEKQTRMTLLHDTLCAACDNHQKMQQANPAVKMDLNWCLGQMNKAFVDFRYAYEDLQKMKAFVGYPYIAARKLVLELKPDWTAYTTDLDERLESLKTAEAKHRVEV